MLRFDIYRFAVSFLLAATSVLLFAGCSGAGNSSTVPATQQRGSLRFTVVWPQRNAKIGRNIPQATNSITVKINNSAGFTATKTLARPADGNDTAASFTQVPVGSTVITANAYASTDGSGVSQAVAITTVLVTFQQITPVTLNLTSTVTTVSIGQYPTTLSLGNTSQLVATARDASNHIVPVLAQPNGFYWTTSDTTIATIDQTGLLTAMKDGTVSITAQERESGATGSVTVQITGIPTGNINITLADNPVVTLMPLFLKITPGGTQQFTVKVTGVPNQGVIWSVLEPGGGTITPTGLYTAPNCTGVYHVVATSIARRNVTATAIINIINGAQIFIGYRLGTSGGAIECMNGFTHTGSTVFWVASTPLALTIGPDGILRSICDLANVTNPAGTGGLSDQFNQPGGLACGPDGKFYVADTYNNRIVRIDDLTGTNWTTLGGLNYGTSAGLFLSPTAIAFGPDGKIYVLDTGNNRIVRMNDITGAGWTTFGSYGVNGTNRFNHPSGIAISPLGKIYVADWGNNRIVRMDDMSGTNWTTFGTQGGGINQFYQPMGIYIGSDLKIYVADSGNARIVRVDDILGTNWATLPIPADNTNLVAPVSILVH